MSANNANKKVKFVASDPARGGLPVKRKQVQQACASCRRKKVSFCYFIPAVGPILIEFTSADAFMPTMLAMMHQ